MKSESYLALFSQNVYNFYWLLSTLDIVILKKKEINTFIEYLIEGVLEFIL